MKKSYWFVLEPYVHIKMKKDNLLLYNTLNGKAIESKNQESINRLVKRLISKKNLLVTKLTNKDLENSEIAEFVENIRENFMGDLLDSAWSEKKPVQMPPILNIQKDVQKLKKNAPQLIGENVMNYLSEISLFINGTCSQECSMCKQAYRQFMWCTKTQTSQHHELDLHSITTFLHGITRRRLSKLNIIGGDIFKYSQFSDLVLMLNKIPIRKAYWIHYLNLIPTECIDVIHNTSAEWNILVTITVNLSRDAFIPGI